MHPLLQLLFAAILPPRESGSNGVTAVTLSPGCEDRIRKSVWYRSEDGTAYFRFCLVERRDGRLRIYILEQPDYGAREQDGHSTHRIRTSHTYGGRPLHSICWSGDIRTVSDALAIAREWSERTLDYIRTGTRFGEGA